MKTIGDILQDKKVSSAKVLKPVAAWQDLAAIIYRDLGGVDTEKASVFKYCKDDYAKAYAGYKECKSRGVNILYWFKIMANAKSSRFNRTTTD